MLVFIIIQPQSSKEMGSESFTDLEGTERRNGERSSLVSSLLSTGNKDEVPNPIYSELCGGRTQRCGRQSPQHRGASEAPGLLGIKELCSQLRREGAWEEATA